MPELTHTMHTQSQSQSHLKHAHHSHTHTNTFQLCSKHNVINKPKKRKSTPAPSDKDATTAPRHCHQASSTHVQHQAAPKNTYRNTAAHRIRPLHHANTATTSAAKKTSKKCTCTNREQQRELQNGIKVQNEQHEHQGTRFEAILS